MKIINDCYHCINKRNVPGDCHIQCAKPDPEMTGSPYGIKHGWFHYPSVFDPVWMTKECVNYEAVVVMIGAPVIRWPSFRPARVFSPVSWRTSFRG